MKNTAQAIVSKKTALTGGQAYGSHIKGGVLLVAGKLIDQGVFALSVNDTTSQPFAKVLTNLENAGKMGAGERFTGYQVALRVVKLGGVAATDAEVASANYLLSTTRVRLFIGSNRTKILDVEASHLVSPIAGIRAAGDSSLPQNVNTWINLPSPQPFDELQQIAAEFEYEDPAGVPAGLGYVNSAPTHALILLVAGNRQVTT